jgi:class 3 adenylate cyclase
MTYDESARRIQARYERLAASPGTAAAFAEALCDIDVRDDLDSIRAPTLVRISRNPVLDAMHGEAIAARIPDARVEEAGNDWRWMSDTDLESSSISRVADFLGVRYEPHPHRLLATILFTDIVSSTARAADIGDERWRLLLDAHDREVIRQVGEAGGQVINTTGDGVLAVFPTATTALGAAIAIREALMERSVTIRAGLHTGEIDQIGPNVSGLGVHIGARVAASAGSGEILVSSTVRQAVSGSGLAFIDRGTHQLKGVPDQWHLFALAE